ncbi:MAG: polyprenyl glycosylphosphotransferase [Microbacteriaceae bacterium]|jgi:exopolysaccharide biosynthesis polyprenyl glycosylphosphotransferase|nr:polyprenyl glycosylphosphotransferase [Microbacteriaceae bacterium]
MTIADGSDDRMSDRSENTSVATVPQPTVKGLRSGWADKYAMRLVFSDLVIVIVIVLGSQVLWFGLRPAAVSMDRTLLPAINYSSFSIILIVVWMLMLSGYGTRDGRVVGIGTMEYKRIADATLRLFGLVAIASLLFRLDLARGYLVTALPLGLVALIASRWLWRRWLVRKRKANQYLSTAVLVGSASSVGHIVDLLKRYPFAGYSAVGACLPKGQMGSDTVFGLPVIGDISDVAAAVKGIDADTVILTSSDHLSPDVVKRIGWSLESTRVEFIVAPSLLDTAGPRIHTRPFAGLPLIHVEVPRYEGSKHTAKTIFDFSSALFGTILISPLLLVVAALVRFSSDGPVLFRQPRVGLNGEVFSIYKFRTMVVDAEARLADLRASNEGSGPLFKLRSDPRITRVGSFLRRYSIDELPQLFNVLRGEMSIVGPRPPLPSEVEQYEPDVRRRLLVKPGITGPWQTNGRSDLRWEDGVRLDLYYVENWTLTGDIVIMWRTVKAVLENRGAY